MTVAKAEFPQKLQPLFKKSRYKVLYGGRCGAKSWGIARALLILGAQKPLRILCAREYQTSIKDSVHKLLSDQIIAMGLTSFYEITQAAIRGINGSEFAFVGLKNNVSKVNSERDKMMIMLSSFDLPSIQTQQCQSNPGWRWN